MAFVIVQSYDTIGPQNAPGSIILAPVKSCLHGLWSTFD